MKPERLAQLQGTTVLVIGDVMLDRYIVGGVVRLSPEAPVPVVTVGARTTLLGGAANVAANVTSLGAKAVLVGRIGPDENGQRVRGLLQDHGIQDHVVNDQEAVTTTKTRVMAGNHQVVRFDDELVHPMDHNWSRLALAVRVADVVVLQDYGKGVVTQMLVDRVRTLCHRLKTPWVVDPNGRWLDFSGAWIVKPNLAEFHARFPDIDPLEPRGLAIARADLNVHNLVVTLGPNGMVWNSTQTEALDVPLRANGRKVDVYDVSGAGDTAAAILACAVPHLSLADGVHAANQGAAAVVARAGVAQVQPQDLTA